MEHTLDIGPTAPVLTPSNAFEAWAVRFLRDPRDLLLLRTAAIPLCTMVPAAIVMFAFPQLVVWIALPYWLFLFRPLADRILLLVHVTGHRPMFRFRAANVALTLVLCGLFGVTPGTFFTHHVVMHHGESNGPKDLSSTLAYQRDDFRQFLVYWLDFQVRSVVLLPRYLAAEGRSRLATRFVVGLFVWWAILAVLLWWNWQATFVVYVAPSIAVQFMLMAGNWAQHAFVDPLRHDQPTGNATTLLYSRSNRVNYNDGFHAVHHHAPGMHWSEVPAAFTAAIDQYRQDDALVFTGIANFPSVWFLLMRRDYDRLARHYVDLGHGRSHDEVVALLQSRTRPVDVTTPAEQGLATA